MIFLSLLYFFVFLVLALAVKAYPVKRRHQNLFFSVVVPFRNEKRYLGPLLDALQKQSHRDREFIFVNDHSDDGGEELLTGKELTLLHLYDEYGKLAALAKGSRVANGEYLVFCDADCSPKWNWLETLNKRVHDDALLFAGFVEIEGSSFFTLDMFMLIGIAAGLDFFRIPSSCAGGNLVVRRDVYETFLDELDGENSLTEDTLLLHTLYKKGWGDSFFFFDPDTVIKTRGYASAKEFIRQRIRWLKGGYRLDLRLFVFLSFIFVSHLLFLLHPLYLIVAAAGQYIFLRTLLKRFRRIKLLYLFPFYFFFHIIYTILSGILFLFLSGEVEWKGRKY
ncbi:MAG TPA: glycosyltransferase [Candidatus Mcinerneyibacteriales bacterium]|nr:glycosyltransferase [Candidatus Mcinerneyibacteriales bacterium]